MSRPPKSTLILSCQDKLHDTAVIGIDTQFFTVNNLLRGIKLVPAGIHLFHYSNSVDDGTSVRLGRWFACKDGDVITVRWNEESCEFYVENVLPAALGDMYQHMVAYPEDSVGWSRLTSHIDTEAIEEFTPGNNIPVSTATPLQEENMVLYDILMARNPRQVLRPDDDELRYTIILHNKVTSTSTDASHVTANALDRSWHLKELFGHDLEILLAEMQMSFIHFIILGNVCSCTQWLSLLKLLLMSATFLNANASFAESFLLILGEQLKKIPPEYITPSLDLAVVDHSVYSEVMENLYHIFGGTSAWADLKKANQQLGIYLNFTSKVDGDDFEVFDLNALDEADEDAPVVVGL